jgi:hypothetical protein
MNEQLETLWMEMMPLLVFLIRDQEVSSSISDPEAVYPTDFSHDGIQDGPKSSQPRHFYSCNIRLTDFWAILYYLNQTSVLIPYNW